MEYFKECKEKADSNEYKTSSNIPATATSQKLSKMNKKIIAKAIVTHQGKQKTEVNSNKSQVILIFIYYFFLLFKISTVLISFRLTGFLK